MKISLAGFVIIFVLLSPVSGISFAKSNDGSFANWTVIYYICGEEGMEKYANVLMENLSKIGSTQDFNLVALIDGNGYNDSRFVYFDNLSILIIGVVNRY